MTFKLQPLTSFVLFLLTEATGNLMKTINNAKSKIVYIRTHTNTDINIYIRPLTNSLSRWYLL